MQDLNIIRIFLQVARHGSFTKAAERLGGPKSRVSRGVARLEEKLGTQLVKRTTRSIQLTPAGAKLYELTHSHLEAIEEAISQVHVESSSMVGELRLSTPADVAEALLPQILKSYNEQYPEVSVHAQVTNEYIDFVDAPIDVALRIGNLPSSTLIQRHLLDVYLVLAASPAYLEVNQVPNSLEDLADHHLLLFDVVDDRFHFPQGTSTKSDNFHLLLELALNGQGVALLPDFYAQAYFERGQLGPVLAKWRGPKRGLHLVYSPTKHMPEKVRRFIDTAIMVCSNH